MLRVIILDIHLAHSEVHTVQTCHQHMLHYSIENWLREPDLNRRPSGYEPDELPNCSIPRPTCEHYTPNKMFYKFVNMVPREGLEPSHPKALAPHASVSTNFTISASNLCRLLWNFVALRRNFTHCIFSLLDYLTLGRVNPLRLSLMCRHITKY